MPPRDPTKVQLDFPLLVADLIRQLNLTGSLGVLDFSPQVVPVFIVGDRDLQVEAVPPLYLPAQIFSGTVRNPGSGNTFVDTGQLPAGDYDVILSGTIGLTSGGPRGFNFEHRDAANAVSLHSWLLSAANNTANNFQATFALRIAENERIRATTNAVLTTSEVGATIMVAIRPIP